MSEKWRVGRSLGRTLYLRTGGDNYKADKFVGIMDTSEFADAVVATMNGMDDFRIRGLASIEVDYRAWLRYGDRDARYRAKTVAWVLAGNYQHTIPGGSNDGPA